MDDAIARSISFVVPRMAEDTNTNASQKKRKTRYILWRVEKRTQMVGTGGSETHTLHEWAAPAGNPPAAGGRGIRRVDPRGALLPQSLSAPTFATHHVSKKKKKTHPATYDFHPPVAGMPLQFFFFFCPPLPLFTPLSHWIWQPCPSSLPRPPYSTRLLLALACECKKRGGLGGEQQAKHLEFLPRWRIAALRRNETARRMFNNALFFFFLPYFFFSSLFFFARQD